METFTAPIPDAGLNRKTAPRILGADFGDGFSESVPDGINTMLLELEPSWKLLTFEEGDAMDAFLRAQEGKRFLWKMPRETTPRVWKCLEWSFVENQTTSDISAKFREQPPL